MPPVGIVPSHGLSGVRIDDLFLAVRIDGVAMKVGRRFLVPRARRHYAQGRSGGRVLVSNPPFGFPRRRSDLVSTRAENPFRTCTRCPPLSTTDLERSARRSATGRIEGRCVRVGIDAAQRGVTCPVLVVLTLAPLSRLRAGRTGDGGRAMVGAGLAAPLKAGLAVGPRGPPGVLAWTSTLMKTATRPAMISLMSRLNKISPFACRARPQSGLVGFA